MCSTQISMSHLDQFARAVQAHLLSQLGQAQHLWRELVNVGDGLGADGLERNDTAFRCDFKPLQNDSN